MLHGLGLGTPIILGLLLAAWPVAAAQPTCDLSEVPAPQLNLRKTSIGDPPIDESKTVEELTATGEHGGKRVLGLTRAHSSYRISIET